MISLSGLSSIVRPGVSSSGGLGAALLALEVEQAGVVALVGALEQLAQPR